MGQDDSFGFVFLNGGRLNSDLLFGGLVLLLLFLLGSGLGLLNLDESRSSHLNHFLLLGGSFGGRSRFSLLCRQSGWSVPVHVSSLLLCQLLCLFLGLLDLVVDGAAPSEHKKHNPENSALEHGVVQRAVLEDFHNKINQIAIIPS